VIDGDWERRALAQFQYESVGHIGPEDQESGAECYCYRASDEKAAAPQSLP